VTATTVYEAAFAGIELGLSDFVTVDMIAARPDQTTDAAGDLIDTVAVTWQLAGYPGSFTTEADATIDWTASAIAQILYEAQVVQAIYEGKASLADVFTPEQPPPVAPPGGAGIA
jgi:hypothetical protein